MIENSDLIFVRHAESQFNITSHIFREERNLDYDWHVLCTYPEFLSGVKYNPVLLDSSITEKGRNQCLNARKITDQIKPDIILVSPLERTLQTCDLMFGDRGIPIVAEPLLIESFRSSCDISKTVEGKVARFPHINFDNVLKEGNLWFLNGESVQNQAAYKKALQEADCKTHEEAMNAILKLMTDTLIYETPLSMRHRAKKIKQLLQSYREKYQKVAIVAHYNTIRYTVCRSFGEDNEPDGHPAIDNCEVYCDRLEEILKVE